MYVGAPGRLMKLLYSESFGSVLQKQLFSASENAVPLDGTVYQFTTPSFVLLRVFQELSIISTIYKTERDAAEEGQIVLEQLRN